MRVWRCNFQDAVSRLSGAGGPDSTGCGVSLGHRPSGHSRCALCFRCDGRDAPRIWRRSAHRDSRQRAFELAQQKPQCAQARGILDAVGAHGGKLRSRPFRREAVKFHPQRGRQGGGVVVPVARGTRSVGHGLPPASVMNRRAWAPSYHGSEQRADPGRQSHGERTPEGHAQRRLHHIGTARAGADRAEQGQKEQRGD